MKKFLSKIAILALAISGLVPFAANAAAVPIVVSPANAQGWTTSDTRPGGAVNFVSDPAATAGTGALQLTTDSTTAAKAQFMHVAPSGTLLSGVTELSYFTKQTSAPLFAQADPSYQLPVELNGATGFTTLVFEPYQNTAEGAVLPNVWQKWDVAAGLFWSSRTVTCSNGVITGNAGGPATYTLAAIQSACPDATVLGYGVNIGTNNPSYDVSTDLFDFNGTVYDFELFTVPTQEAQCENGGFANFNPPTGVFTSEDQCEHFVKGQQAGQNDNDNDNANEPEHHGQHHGNGGQHGDNGKNRGEGSDK